MDRVNSKAPPPKAMAEEATLRFGTRASPMSAPRGRETALRAPQKMADRAMGEFTGQNLLMDVLRGRRSVYYVTAESSQRTVSMAQWVRGWGMLPGNESQSLGR